MVFGESGVCKFMRDFVDAMLAEVRPQQTGEVEQLVRRIRSEMAKSPNRVDSLKRYAHDAGFSADYVSRKFTEFTGVNFRVERRRYQMARAKRLLTKTSLKVSVIARQLGIEDCSRFTQYFREWSGTTPSAYRKAHRSTKAKNHHSSLRNEVKTGRSATTGDKQRTKHCSDEAFQVPEPRALVSNSHGNRDVGPTRIKTNTCE